MPMIDREIRTGEPYQVGDYEITPQTQVVRVRIPGMHGGLIWNRPKAVLVRTADGQEGSLPVRDTTRLIIWSMLAGGLLGALMIGLRRRR